MAAPPAPTEAQWLQILDAIAWTLARIVIGFTPPNEAGRSWAFANAWSTPRTDTWARELCNEGYSAYDAAVAQHGERVADGNVAGDALVDAELRQLPPTRPGGRPGQGRRSSRRSGCRTSAGLR